MTLKSFANRKNRTVIVNTKLVASILLFTLIFLVSLSLSSNIASAHIFSTSISGKDKVEGYAGAKEV